MAKISTGMFFPERYSETMRTHLLNRRDFIAHARNGISSIALASLLCEQDLMAEGSVPIDSSDPFRPRLPQKRARARNVIVVFCAGALSHVDFWEFKPEMEPCINLCGNFAHEGNVGK